jgi:aminoglycoside phosphotransferase (APT) family kinase protein
VVAAHNDLTMSNLLVTGAGRLGVLDWEAAGERMPLADLFYAAVDAASAQDYYADRVEAFQRCFEAGGRWCRVVGESEARIRSATETSCDVAALSFHGCWLQHAAAEAEKRAPGEPRPFLRIVERIADRSLRSPDR